MKLSQRTLNILKNFSIINPGIVINPSESKQEISTVMQGNKIVAFAKIDETFNVRVAYHALDQFLNAYNKAKDEVLVDFQEGVAVIKYNNKSQARLRYSNVETVLALPDVLRDGSGNPKTDSAGNAIRPRQALEALLGTPLVTFDLSAKQLSDLTAMSGVLGLPDMRIEPVDGKILIRMYKERPSGVESKAVDIDDNTYEIEVGEWDGPKFALDLEVSLLKVISDDYKLEFSTKIVHFVSKNQELEYFIGTRNTSSFGG